MLQEVEDIHQNVHTLVDICVHTATVERMDGQPAVAGTNSPALDKLLTTEQELLLDTADKLRNHGVSEIVDIPQIIVCGDQSSGKSSVLEALSRLSFPRGHNLCTTFPIELVLRRGDTRTVRVRWHPASSRTEPQKSSLLSFQPNSTPLEDFETLINEAKAHLRQCLGSAFGENTIFEDTLEVEVTDPKWPRLSLIDLPGLLGANNPDQTVENATVPRRLCEKYMSNPKSIILAVVSAGYPFQVGQLITCLKEHNPTGDRTLCVITKPDTDRAPRDTIPLFVRYAKGTITDYQYAGWHILRNLDTNEIMDGKDRDKTEKLFFATSHWSKALRHDQLGIDSLRTRLSTMLEQHMRANLSEVVDVININLKTSKEELQNLGSPRADTQQQGVYLTELSGRFHTIVQQAVDGYYQKSKFFKSDPSDINPHRLRGAVQNLNESFAAKMHECGHSIQIIKKDENGTIQADWPRVKSLDKQEGYPSLPQQMTREEYILRIKELAREDKGKELPGSYNPQLIESLFREQAKNWGVLASDHLKAVWTCVSTHLTLVAKYLATPETAVALRRYLFVGELEQRWEKVTAKLEELRSCHEQRHPITYDRDYSKIARMLARQETKSRLLDYQRLVYGSLKGSGNEPDGGLQIDQILDALYPDEEGKDDSQCAVVFNCVRAYYEASSSIPLLHLGPTDD